MTYVLFDMDERRINVRCTSLTDIIRFAYELEGRRYDIIQSPDGGEWTLHYTEPTFPVSPLRPCPHTPAIRAETKAQAWEIWAKSIYDSSEYIVAGGTTYLVCPLADLEEFGLLKDRK